jgi:hypothetical protein
MVNRGQQESNTKVTSATVMTSGRMELDTLMTSGVRELDILMTSSRQQFDKGVTSADLHSKRDAVVIHCYLFFCFATVCFQLLLVIYLCERTVLQLHRAYNKYSLATIF